MSSSCNLSGCGKAGGKQCSQCKSVFYCDEICQRKDWKEHRPFCKTIKKQLEEKKTKDEEGQSGRMRMLGRSWAVGLSQEKQREWLVDCYRMRLDDEYVCRGELRSGSLYKEGSMEDMMQDFLVFCRLAQSQGALPNPWDWGKFLATAATLIWFAFEKSDAKEKYGSENYFNSMTGGRSLRFTGEFIYGSPLTTCSESELQKKLEEEVKCKPRTASMVANIGGEEAWDDFEMMMKENEKIIAEKGHAHLSRLYYCEMMMKEKEKIIAEKGHGQILL